MSTLFLITIRHPAREVSFMGNLLSANFSRLFKDKIFWICMILMAALGCYVYVNSLIEMKAWDLEVAADNNLFGFCMFTAIFQSVFVSIFTGTEYNDGTLRNKLAVGHSRAAIYLANMIVCSVAGLLMCLAYMAVALIIGLPFLGSFDTAPGVLLLFALASFLMRIVISVLFSFLAMLIQNRSITAVINIAGVFILLMAAVYIQTSLAEPEMASYYAYTVNEDSGTVSDEIAGEQPNPNYVSGLKREIYIFLNDFLPTGQTLALTSKSSPYPQRLALYSGIIIVAVTGAGICFFRKKDIK